MLSSHMACEQCGEPIRLESFRLPPRTCPHCGDLRDPAAARENFGCMVMLPVAIVTMVAFGFIGVLIGRILSPFVNDADLEWRLGFLAAIDGLGIVSLLQVRLFQGEERKQATKPLYAFLMFSLFGMKCGHGHGIAWLVFAGVVNGVLATTMTHVLLNWVKRRQWGRLLNTGDEGTKE